MPLGRRPFCEGRDRLWPIPFWPSSFDQIWPIHFWPSWFWPGQFGPKPILANPFLANLFFGSGVCQRVGPHPEKNGLRIVGPRIVGPEGWGPEGWGAQNFVFFSVSRHHFRSFVSHCVSSRGFLVVFGSAGAVKCSRLEFSGCRVKPRRPRSRRGFTRQPESPNVHV